MKTSSSALLASLLVTSLVGCARCDTGSGHVATNLVSSAADPVASSSLNYPTGQNIVQDPNLYYNNYPADPYSNGYYDYSDQDTSLFASQEQDRQDVFAVSSLAGLIPIATVMFAAMAGSLMAPAVGHAGRALFDAVMAIPEIEINLPKFGDEAEEDVTEARSLSKSSNMWARIMTNVANNLAEEFNTNYKAKFQKLLSNNRL